ncbi:GroES-like protein [Obba rivulosa]|uniref:GroES-like protein n=1 Tax=Obba rivulosa TaxID=1052685 RepID=A0A8E2AQV8_9APHY|nr:GroES-like protein [Obba rivulosa]
MSSKTMKAIVTNGDGTYNMKDVDVPTPGPGEILVKVVAASQNPTDWKTALLHQQPGNILGCDFAGVVADIGSDVDPALAMTPGKRVAGAVHGGVSPNGAFAEYVTVPADMAIAIPETLSFEDASQLGIACYTTCQCLYQAQHLPTPLEPAEAPLDVLVWSGTSSTGQYAVQFAKLAGLRVLSTASPKNFELVKALGADEVFDYADSKTPRRIAAATGGALKHAVDCISEGMTPNQVSMSLSKEGGTISTLLPYESRKKGVQTVFVLAYTFFGKDIQFPFVFPANPEHRKNASMYCKLIEEVVSRFGLKPNPARIFPHGLASIPDGFEYMRSGKVSAEKITYRIADTPGLAT